MELKDKVAFITGGASGLGRATAERFVQAGAKVILFDLNEENAEKAAQEIGPSATYAAGDVADEASVTAAIEKGLSEFGAIVAIRIPVRARSRAMGSVIPATPPLLAL